jgi:hypothetical protein
MIVDGIRQRLAERLEELGEGARSKAIRARLRQHQLGETFAVRLLKRRTDGKLLPDPGLSKLERLAKALNVSRSWFFLGIDKSDPIFDLAPDNPPPAPRLIEKPSKRSRS